MTLVGASPEELERAAQQLDEGAAQLDRSAKEMSATLGSFAWLGRAAIAFTDSFSGRHKPRMLTTASFLRDNARTLRQQAQQQRQASQPGGTGGGGAPGGILDRGTALAGGLTVAGAALGRLLRSDGFSWTTFGVGMGSLGLDVARSWTALGHTISAGRAKNLRAIPAAERNISTAISTSAKTLKSTSRLARWAGKIGGPLNVAATLLSVGSAVGTITSRQSGWAKTRAVLGAGLDVTGMFFPPVAWGKGAWDVGWMTGSFIARTGTELGPRLRGFDPASEADREAMISYYAGPVGALRTIEDTTLLLNPLAMCRLAIEGKARR